MSGKIFIWLLATVLLITVTPAEAQEPTTKIPRIGFLTNVSASDSAASLRFDSFRQGLRDLGYVEGKTIVIESRYAEGNLERLPELAEDLIRLKVDIFVVPNDLSARAAKKATATLELGHRQSRPAGRQCHGSNKLRCRVARKTPGPLKRSYSQGLSLWISLRCK